MRTVTTSAHEVASRYLGLAEVAGSASNPEILAMLKLDGDWPQDDAVPWCSAFANWVAFQLGLPRSKSLAARSWLSVGAEIELKDAEQGLDVVVLERNGGGHVGFYDAHDATSVRVLGGNQGDAVSFASFPIERVLGVRRLA